MRSTCEIIADIKDGKEVPYEELKMACLVQSSLLFFFKNDTKSLLKGGIAADLVRRMNYKDEKTSSVEAGIPSWYWKGIKADPYKWLSEKDIPGTEEWKKWHSIGTKLLNKFTSNQTQKSGWIPCSERLPEEGEEVLGTDGKYIYLTKYDADIDAGFGDIDGIIAWQPLPEPYRAADNKQD